jgi:hypothetical protein
MVKNIYKSYNLILDMTKRSFRKKEKQTDENISKIFDPEDKFKRKQKEVLENIFG